jgi:hypothetical protein
MPTPTYKPLANITLGSNTSSVTFSSISQAYRDLILVIDGKTSVTGADTVFARYNSDSGSNYSLVRMTTDGSTYGSAASSETGAAIGIPANNTAATVYTVNIMDYTATDKHKTALSR